MKKFLTRAEVARLLDLHPRTLSRNIERGLFPKPDVIVGHAHRWSTWRLAPLFRDREAFHRALREFELNEQQRAAEREERRAALAPATGDDQQ